MAERIVSPGVFTRETDISFLPQGIAEIGLLLSGNGKRNLFQPLFVTSLSLKRCLDHG